MTLKKGYNMLAVNFQNVADAATGISIQDLIPGTTEGLAGFTGGAKADQIMYWDSSVGEYETYFLYYNARQTSNVKN